MNLKTPRSPATNAALVAGRIHRAADARLLPEHLPLEAETRKLWTDVTSDDGVLQHPIIEPVRRLLHRLRKTAERYCPSMETDTLLIRLAAAGVAEWRLRLVPLHHEQVIEACFAGKAHRHIDAIDRDEQQYEAREDHLTLERRIAEAKGDEVSEAALLEEAEINEIEAAIQLERARTLRRRAHLKAFRQPSEKAIAAS